MENRLKLNTKRSNLKIDRTPTTLVMQVPKVEKIVINMGVGDIVANART